MTPVGFILLLATEFFLISAFSYIFFGETRIYNVAENVAIGGGVAYGIITMIKTLKTSALDPMAAGDWGLIIPLIIGFAVFSRLTESRWISRYAVALIGGLGVGVVFGKAISAQILGQISATVSNVITGKPDPISAIVLLIGVITTVSYFIYTARIANPLHTGRLRYFSMIGRLFLFASFGYLFATDAFSNIDPLVAFMVKALGDFLRGLGILA